MLKIKKLDRKDIALICGLGLVLVLQGIVMHLSPLNLAGDEAYYWLWSKHLDYCYYEKGPGIALLIALGCKIFGDTMLGIRSGALFCQFLISIILYFFLLGKYDRKIATLSLLAYWSTLLFGTLGLFMTCDPPLCLFWLLSLIFANTAIVRNDAKYWFPALVCIGCAALFKYTSLILFPSYILYLLVTPAYRKNLVHPAFILGCIAVIVLMSPVVIWNYQHDWINLAKAYGHMGNEKRKLGVGHFFELIFGQWGMLGPILFPLMVFICHKSYKNWRIGDFISGFYLCTFLPLVAVCLILSFQRSVYANWPMPIYLGVILLFAYFMSKQNQISEKLITKALTTNFVVLFLAHSIFTGSSFGLPAKILPSSKLTTGRDLGEMVNEKLQSSLFEQCNDGESKPPFILTERYMDASLMAFYSTHADEIYLADPRRPRISQFDMWQNWESLKGRNALLVFASEEEIPGFESHFSKVVEHGLLTRSYDDQLIGKSFFYVACNFNGNDFSTLTIKRST